MRVSRVWQIGLLLAMAVAFGASQDSNVKKEGTMHKAVGGFEVKLNPFAGFEPSLGSMSIDKSFHGDLEATSKGQMLSAMGEVKGSAGYVAMERVTGTLGGKKGSFVLQHSATMTRGVPELSVTVVPDSGTDELKGLSGTMKIIIEAGKHSYEFDYKL
jgi:hypothetical protein